MFNILAPELIVLVAVKEYLSAKKGEKKIEDEGWTLAHAFFADMGGFKIQVLSHDSSASAGDNEATRELERRMSPDALDSDQGQYIHITARA